MGDNKMKKLKDLLGEVFDDTPKVDKHKVIEGVRNYGIVGKSLYNNSNIMEHILFNEDLLLYKIRTFT